MQSSGSKQWVSAIVCDAGNSSGGNAGAGGGGGAMSRGIPGSNINGQTGIGTGGYGGSWVPWLNWLLGPYPDEPGSGSVPDASGSGTDTNGAIASMMPGAPRRLQNPQSRSEGDGQPPEPVRKAGESAYGPNSEEDLRGGPPTAGSQIQVDPIQPEEQAGPPVPPTKDRLSLDDLANNPGMPPEGTPPPDAQNDSGPADDGDKIVGADDDPNGGASWERDSLVPVRPNDDDIVYGYPPLGGGGWFGSILSAVKRAGDLYKFFTRTPKEVPKSSPAAPSASAKTGPEEAQIGPRAAGNAGAKAASNSLPPLTGKAWPNHSPELLGEELKIAADLGVQPIKVVSPESLASLAGKQIKFAVSMEGELFAIPRGVEVGGKFTQISHAVLVKGADVLAAGEASIVGNVVTTISRWTGHYKVDQASLAIAKEAFRRAGFIFQ